MNKYSTGDVMRRREEIASIIRQMPVHSQEELLTHLRRKGFVVTQPTLSRDMRELGLAKTPNGYMLPSELVTPATVLRFTPREVLEGRLEMLLRDSVISAE